MWTAGINATFVAHCAISVKTASCSRPEGWASGRALSGLDDGHVGVLGIRLAAVGLALVGAAPVVASANVEGQATKGRIHIGDHAKLGRADGSLESSTQAGHDG